MTKERRGRNVLIATLVALAGFQAKGAIDRQAEYNRIFKAEFENAANGNPHFVTIKPENQKMVLRGSQK